MTKRTISAWKDLQGEVPSILERLELDQALALAAAVNPVLALEELGYEIAPSARPTIEARLRFGPRVGARALRLIDQLRDQLGHPVDADDDDAVRDAIAELGLTLGGPGEVAQAGAAQARKRRPTSGVRSRRPLRDEDLEPLRDSHPFVATLLEYRKLAAVAPRMAPRRTFDAVRRGERTLLVTRVRGRLIPGADAPPQQQPPEGPLG